MKIYSNSDNYYRMKQLFQELAGQDVWVLVEGNYGYKYYIKVVNFYDAKPFSIIKYNRLPTWWTDVLTKGYEMDRVDHKKITKVLNGTAYNGDLFHDEIDLFTVCDPVEIMTTEEMQEILDNQPLVDEE